MSNDLAPYTSSKELLHQALLDAGSSVKNNKYFCIFHDDHKNPNGSIKEIDGKWRFKCFSCGASGDYFDIIAHNQGRPLNDVIAETLKNDKPIPVPKEKATKKAKKRYRSIDEIVQMAERMIKGTCTQRYSYNNPDTRELDICVIRIEKHEGGKEFWQCYPVDGGYEIGLPKDTLRPLYNRARIRLSDTIILVEGEKCVHALAKHGIVATTALGGVNSIDHVDWAPLTGKSVILWPDNDPPDPKTGLIPGQEYIKGAMRNLGLLSPEPSIATIDPKAMNLGPKEDAADYIEREEAAGRNTDAIRKGLLEAFKYANRHGTSAKVIERIQHIIDGTYVTVPWAYPILSNQTRALKPGTVTIVGGTPGSNKSFFVMENAMDLHDRGVSLAILMLEEDKTYWAHRAMVIRDEMSKHFEDEWVQKNPQEALEAAHRHAAWLDDFGKCLHTTDDLYNRMETVVKWVNEQCQKRTRIIIVDPITLALCEGDLFREELKWLSHMKSDCRAAGSSLVLVTHPKQGNIPIGMNALAGSAAYQRVSQTILWIEHLDEDTEMDIVRLDDSGFGAPTRVEQTVKCNRRIHLLKTRNSSGHGLKLAYHFFGKTMSFSEQGLITKSVHKNKAGA